MSYRPHVKRYRSVVLCLGLLWSAATAQYTYVEGTDTTDAAGKGLDGLFTIRSSFSDPVDGDVVWYGTMGYGYFNCTFDDLQKVPDSIRSCTDNITDVVGHCFLVCKSSDSTWAKVQITRQLPDKRYVYRYGMNRTSRNKLLVPPDYDRQRIYRPNNIFWSEVYAREINGRWEIVQDVTLSWEPPLPCSRPVLGYIVYGTWEDIDTAQPINPDEWEKLGTTSAGETEIHMGPGGLYLDVVAVYQGDTSDFSRAFTPMDYPIGISSRAPRGERNGAFPSVIDPSGRSAETAVRLFTFDGRRVAGSFLSEGRWTHGAAGTYIRLLCSSDHRRVYKTMVLRQ